MVSTPPSIEEAERRLASLPSLKSTLVGVIIGIGISIFAQLILKPFSYQSYQVGNNITLVTYFGNQKVGEITPFLYYFGIVAGLFLSLVAWWLVQKRVTGITGIAVKEVPHGMDHSKLEGYVEKLDRYLDDKLRLHGYELQNYQTQAGEFVRAVRFRDGEDDLLKMKVKPYVVTVEAPIKTDSIQAARTVITYINTMEPSKPDSPAIF